VTLDCLKGLIGLSEQVEIVPSGLYVVALPGISLANITKIADKNEQADSRYEPDPQAVFNDCEKRAILRFRNAFIAAMSKCWHLNDLDVAECIICEYRARLATSLWWYMGHEIMVERVSSDRLNRFTTLDKKKAVELRDEMFDTATVELENLVKGLNPNSSGCIPDDDPVACGNIVTTVTSLP
jgi:hypothetical protein